MSPLNRNGGGFSRRALTIGGGIAAALGIAALGVSVPRMLGKHYRQSAYDDLLSQLADRGAAVIVGQAAIKTHDPQVVVDWPPPLEPSEMARALRQRLERRSLAEVSNADIAEGKLLEVQGWVLPGTVTVLCMLAALES